MKEDDLLDIVIQKLRWLRLPLWRGASRTSSRKHAPKTCPRSRSLTRSLDEEKASRLRSAID